MGSLSYRPKVPTGPSVVYITQPTTTTTTTSTDSAESVFNASEARTESLLRRSRGRLGTIQTSLKGLLSANDESKPRKTLLGE